MTRFTHIGQRALIAMLLLIAVVERFAWAARRGWVSTAGEATTVATAIAQGRGFSDAYFTSSGPTAHLLPTTPLLAGGVKWLAGFGSTAEIILQVIASLEMIGGYVLLFVLFSRLRMPLMPRILALATLCIVPIFLGQESLDFRYWEGGLAIILSTASLIMIIDLDRQTAQPSHRQVIAFSTVFALTFFTSPPLGLASGACSLLVLFRKPQWRGRTVMGAVAAAMLLGLLTPWVIRNELTMGKPVLLRSNMPLELTIANNDWQLVGASKTSFQTSMAAYHPSVLGPGNTRLRQIGEIAYMAELSNLTTRWISEHPVGFAKLCARHLRQMFFPDAYQFEIGSGTLSRPRAILFTLIAAFGLLALALNVIRGRANYGFVAIFILVVALTYLPFQPMARYLYLNYGLLLFCGFTLLPDFACLVQATAASPSSPKSAS